MSSQPSRRFLPLALMVGLGATLAAGSAQAYCRTSTASTPTVDGHVCTPPDPDDLGAPIRWYTPRISYSLQKDASVDVPLEAARAAVRAAFDAWMAAECDGGEPPRIELVETEAVECSRHEYNRDDKDTEEDENRGNANILFFRDAGWNDEPERLAVTTVTFNLDSGEIYDADMALNSDLWHFTTSGSGAGIDLVSVLTHETGHFLGLAHAKVPGATMDPNYSPPEIEDLRTLGEDDRAGICAIYPPGPIAELCDTTPRHGFSALCAADQPGPVPDAPDAGADRCCCLDEDECVSGICVEVAGGCTCATSSAPGAPWQPGLLLAALGATLARRRGRRV